MPSFSEAAMKLPKSSRTIAKSIVDALQTAQTFASLGEKRFPADTWETSSLK